MRTRFLAIVFMLASVSFAQAQSQTLLWSWTAMYPALPSGTVQDIGQLDGVGADEIVIYHPPTGATWIVWVRRGTQGEPVYCIQTDNFPPGFASVRIGHFDTWEFDENNKRQDLVLIPHSGPLYFATTVLNRAGSCYQP